MSVLSNPQVTLGSECDEQPIRTDDCGGREVLWRCNLTHRGRWLRGEVKVISTFRKSCGGAIQPTGGDEGMKSNPPVLMTLGGGGVLWRWNWTHWCQWLWGMWGMKYNLLFECTQTYLFDLHNNISNWHRRMYSPDPTDFHLILIVFLILIWHFIVFY